MNTTGIARSRTIATTGTVGDRIGFGADDFGVRAGAGARPGARFGNCARFGSSATRFQPQR